MILWKDQFRPKSLSLINNTVLLSLCSLVCHFLIKLNMYDMKIIYYGLKFIYEISHLDYRPIYFKTFYISFDPQITVYPSVK